MSRVFVSCAYRDRSVARRLERVLHILGHEPLDELDDARGQAWWNEVVGRIESSDVFLAVVTQAYAESQACRLGAKHAATSGLRVVRVDIGDEEVRGCHPAVAAAPRVRFDPDADIMAVARLGVALEEPTSQPTPGDPAREGPPRRRVGRMALAGVAAIVLVAAALAVTRTVGADRGADREASTTTAPAPAAPVIAPSPAPDAAAVQRVLAAIGAADSLGLQPASCQAGDRDVTCRNPAPYVRTVVLRAYPTSHALYDAYVAAVSGSSGEPVPENVGDCTRRQSQGEVAWNLDRVHRSDITIEEQAAAGLDPYSEAAGRVYCTASGEVMTLVWTQDPSLLVAVVGQSSSPVAAWWQEVHLELACAVRGSAVHEDGCRGLAS